MPPPIDIHGSKAQDIAGVIFGALTLFFLFGLIVVGKVARIDFVCN